MTTPQSHSAVLEDDALEKPEADADVEFASIIEEDEAATKAAAPKVDPKAAVVKAADTKAPVVDDEIPEALRGKTVAELAKMYREAQTVIGRQGQEVGQLRALSDRIIKAQLNEKAAAVAAAKAAAPAVEKTDVDFFADPKASVADAIANHPLIKKIETTLGVAERDRAVARAQASTARFNELHPDAADVIRDEEFQKWVGASTVRQALFRSAHNRFALEAGVELFSTWKELKGARTSQATEDAATVAAAAGAAGEAADTKRKAELAAAKVPSGGGRAGPNKAGAKIYRRADLMELRINDPDRYEALSGEIDKAYREGRVK